MNPTLRKVREGWGTRPKIELLNPGCYVVLTSVALSPPNKTAITKAIHPFILQDTDIISSGDIDGMLSRLPEVVRSNLKLWLTSTEILDRVIHNAKVCHT